MLTTRRTALLRRLALLLAVSAAASCCQAFSAPTTHTEAPPELPILTFAEKTLPRVPIVWAPAAAQDIDLGECRWVYGLQWVREAGLVISAASPSLSDFFCLRFAVVGEDGALRERGTWPIGECRSAIHRVVPSAGQLWCTFFAEVSTPRVVGIVGLPATGAQAAKAEGVPAGIAQTPLYMRIDPTPQGDVVCQTGQLAVCRADGEPLGSVDIRDRLWVVLFRQPAIALRDGYYECALPTVASRKLTRWADEPPGDVTLFAIPPQGSGLAPKETSIEPDWEWVKGAPDPTYHGVGVPCLSETTGDMAYREVTEWRTPGELLRVDAVWVWRRATGKSTRIDWRACYSGAGEYVLQPDGAGAISEIAQKQEWWGETGQMLPALSPDGKQVAYLKGERLCIVTLPDA